MGVPISPDLPLHDAIVRAAARSDPCAPWIHPSSVALILARDAGGAGGAVLRSLVALSFTLALRISEVRRLRPVDFDLAAGRVRVYPSKKASLEPVWVAAPGKAMEWARRALEARPNRDPLTPLTTLSSRALNRWLRTELAGTRDQDKSWHGLRRGRATQLAHLGVPIGDIMRVGRWNAASTARRYVHPWAD